MNLIHSFSELSRFREPIHWAMGVFDGLHIGHRAVVESAVREARKSGGLAGVLTFENHPLTCLRPESAPLRLWGNEQDKTNLLREWGIDLELSLSFDRELAAMSPDSFIETLGAFGESGASGSPSSLASISVGEDWRFGSGRAGNIDFLRKKGAELGFHVEAVPHVFWNGERVSSTRIRQAIAAGDMDAAATMLGRPYAIEGVVIHGRELARQLGFPTANIRPLNGQLPPLGVYAVRVCIDGEQYAGMANLGVRPTVEQDGGETLLEVHLFDWKGDLYGREIAVECIRFLRAEKKFDSLDSLKNQIAEDAKMARKVLFENH